MLKWLQRLMRLEWPVRLLRPLIGKFNPFRPDYWRDPYPTYRELRSAAPVYRSPVLRTWILTRYADAARVLRDPHFSVDRSGVGILRLLRRLPSMRGEFAEALFSSLLMIDPPRHTRVRTLVNKAFTPRAVERLRPRVQRLVDELLDAAAERDRVDLIRDLAYPLPVIVIAELLGLPAEDRERLKSWSDTLTVLVDPLAPGGGLRGARSAFLELSDYFGGVFEKRRREPSDDLISALVAAEASGDRLSEAELLSLCALILGAGHETTTNLIGNAVMALLCHPGERKRLQDDPELIGSAVEEFLRYDSPVQATDRVATEDCEIGGRAIRRGQLVGVLLGAANRDPEQFPEPDRLDLGRSDNRHLAFGHGVHFCPGAPLARLEAQVAIGTLVRRFPDFEGDVEAARWKSSMVLRGLLSLPLSL